MSLTKKHFTRAASMVKMLRADWKYADDDEDRLHMLVEHLASWFASENERFDYIKFAEACK